MRETPKVRIYHRPDLVRLYRAHYILGQEFMGEPEPEFMDLLRRLPPRSRLLDVGIGYGRNAAQAVIRGHSVVGIDLMPEALSAADIFIRRTVAGPRQRLANFGIAPGRWSLRRQDLERSRLKVGGRFDAVVTHYATQDLSARAIRRVIKSMQGKTAAGGIFQGTFLIELERGEPRMGEDVPFKERDESQIHSLFDSGELIRTRVKGVSRISRKEMARLISKLFSAREWGIVRQQIEPVAWQHPYATDLTSLKSASRGLLLKFEALKK